MTEPAKPGILDRLRARYRWFDHVMRAQGRYQDRKGDFFAAGITYFTVFALFPLIMVGFAAAGSVLVRRPDLLDKIEGRIRSSVSGDLGETLLSLMDSAIESRTTVGIIGLAVAAWAGLGWMNNLREALSEMWEQRREHGNFVRTKLADLLALVSMFVALTLTIGLTALGDPGLMTNVLEWFGIQDFPALSGILWGASLLVSLLISWLLFTWIIARLPRESVSFRSSVRAGLMAAVGFEIFKQVASLYLQSVMHGPAGTTFGPVLGLMVFAYITARLILFATAWAATVEGKSRGRPGSSHPIPPGSPRVCRSGRVSVCGGRWPRRRWARLAHLAFRGYDGTNRPSDGAPRSNGQEPVEFGDRVVRSKRFGDAADQSVVHPTDQVCMSLSQRVKRAIGHDDVSVLAPRFVPVVAEDLGGQPQRRAGGRRQVASGDGRLGERSAVSMSHAVQRIDHRGTDGG